MNRSQVGVILKLASKSYISTAKTVHHLLTQQLKTSRMYEMWSLIGGRPLRFSLHEFEEITQLNCGEIDTRDEWDIDHRDFWREMDVKPGDGLSWFELKSVMAKCRTWNKEKRKMVALLFVLSVGIYGLHRGNRLPLMAAKRVMDPEAFERYPWGQEGFKELMVSIKIASFDNNSYSVHGCMHAFIRSSMTTLRP